MNEIFLALLKFDLIAYLCEEFISSAVARLSKRLKISEAVAGATLLAVANGSSDIITVIISTDGEGEDFDLAIGILFGASLFIGTFVLASVILNSKRKVINDV